MGPGNSRDIDYSLCKARVYARHCGDILIYYGQSTAKSPAQIPAVKCEIGTESKTPPFHGAGMMLRSKLST